MLKSMHCSMKILKSNDEVLLVKFGMLLAVMLMKILSKHLCAKKVASLSLKPLCSQKKTTA